MAGSAFSVLLSGASPGTFQGGPSAGQQPPVCKLSSLSRETCRGPGLQTVRWQQKPGDRSHLAGHTLCSWPRSSLLFPDSPNRAGSALHAQLTTGRPQTQEGCAANPSAPQASTAKPHNQELLPSITQSKRSTRGGKKSAPCRRAGTCCQRADPAASHRGSCCCPLSSWGPALSLCRVRQEAKGKSK